MKIIFFIAHGTITDYIQQNLWYHGIWYVEYQMLDTIPQNIILSNNKFC